MPLTIIVLIGELTQEPIKSMKELQESDWITKLLDKVSLTVVGIAAEDEGLNVTYKDVD